VDKKNDAIQKLHDIAQTEKVTTGKSSVGDEKRWNVFMRTDSDAVR
jgi:hydroxyacylglutathione hydrolase